MQSIVHVYSYILEKLDQYLIDFPKQALEDNLETVNVDTIIKQIRDFHTAKGTQQFLFTSSFYIKKLLIL